MVAEGKIHSGGSASYDSTRRSTEDTLPPQRDVTDHLREAKLQAFRYVTAQADRLRALVRSALLFGVLGAAGAVVGLTIVVTASVLLCIGLADAIAQLLGGRQWAGDLIVSFAILGAIAIGGVVVVNKVIKSSRTSTIKSYENRKMREPTI